MTSWFETPGLVRRVEVDLSHFAAIGGLTREQYAFRLISLLGGGQIGKIVRAEALINLRDWLAPLPLVSPFFIMIRLSLNRTHDAAIFCSCRQDRTRKIIIDRMVPGLSGMTPMDMAELPAFELSFSDLEPCLPEAMPCQA